MSLYDEYFTNDDKPFAENLNDSLLLSNVFDLTVGVEYPTMCSSAYWGDEDSVKKCSVSIVKIVDYDGVSYNSSGITGTGTVKVNFYPNFNAFGKITAIEWTNTEGITCDVYSEGGQLIQANIPNGTITTQSAGFGVLQNFQLRFHLDDATLSKFKVTMANREDLRYGATVGITNVTGLENRLTSIEGKNTEQDGVLSEYDTRMDNIEAKNTSQDTAINGKAPTDHSSTGTGYGKATNTKYGHVIVDNALDSSSTNPVQNNKVQEALNGKANSNHTHSYSSITGKPSSFTPSSHASSSTTYGVGNASEYGHVKVDADLDRYSINPVQNKVINNALNSKASTSSVSAITNNNREWGNCGLYSVSSGTAKYLVRNGFAHVYFNLSFSNALPYNTAMFFYEVQARPVMEMEFPVRVWNLGDGKEYCGSVRIDAGSNVYNTGTEYPSGAKMLGNIVYPIGGY